MKKEQFNPKKLKSARIYRGKTIDIVSKETGINKKDILAFEEMKYIPTLENIMKLSNNLEFPRQYFVTGERLNINVDASHFNPQSTLPRNEEIAYREKLIMVHRIRLFIEGYIKFPSLNLPNNIDKNDDIEIIANKIRDYWGLENGPIGNMVTLMENNGFILSGLNINKKGASPYTQKQSINDDVRYLTLLGNDRKSATVRNFDLAYELGFIISNELKISAKNFAKEDFASALLLPKDSFIEDLEDPNELESYVEMKARWIVPMTTLIYRAYQLGVISYKKYNYLMTEMDKRGWLKKEPLDDNIKATSPQSLKVGIELLFDNNIMSPNTFMNNLEDFGVIIYSNDVEELADLKEGMLGGNRKPVRNSNEKNNKKQVMTQTVNSKNKSKKTSNVRNVDFKKKKKK